MGMPGASCSNSQTKEKRKGIKMSDKIVKKYDFACEKCSFVYSIGAATQPEPVDCEKCGAPMYCTNPDYPELATAGAEKLGAARGTGVTEKELLAMKKADLREYIAILEGVCNAAEGTLASQSQTMKEQEAHIDKLNEELYDTRVHAKEQTQLAADNLQRCNEYGAELLKLRLAVSNLILNVYSD